MCCFRLTDTRHKLGRLPNTPEQKVLARHDMQRRLQRIRAEVHDDDDEYLSPLTPERHRHSEVENEEVEQKEVSEWETASEEEEEEDQTASNTT